MHSHWSTSSPRAGGTDLHLEVGPGGRRSSIEEALRRAIRDGRLAAGTRVPSSRVLARDLCVARGTVTASLASASTPGMFAWMSIADWDIDGRLGHGEDHDVWSPDQLASLHARRRPT